MTDEWFNAGKLSKFPENEAVLLENTPFGEVVVVFQNGDYNVLSGICSHEEYELDGAPVQEGQLTCMLHMSAFDLKTGEAISPPAEEPLEVFSTKIQNEELLIKKNK